MEAKPCGTIVSNYFFISFSAICCLLKILSLNTYYSTDFEVHRNWLAITSTLQISKWYYEDTSEWTLDYPPLFAWFEFTLSNIASYFDHGMLNIQNLNYATKETVLFQRLSVIICDIFLLYSIKRYCDCCILKDKINSPINKALFVICNITLNAGLFIVDHIHFQYNGFLFAFLMLSIIDMEQGKYLHSAFWFCILLNMKHIYLYLAPVYFIYLLRTYCFSNKHKITGVFSYVGVSPFDFSITNTFKLGSVVVAVFAVSFGPFIYLNQMEQVLSRLFPVKRGLTHAYWAANFWAVYNGADKFLSIVGVKFQLLNVSKESGSLTGGLVAQQSFSVLPNIPILLTAIFTLLAIMPALMKVWYRPNKKELFLPCLVICAYSSFLFGYHVHEKAVLMITIPLTFLAVKSEFYGRIFIILSVCANYALFPLLCKSAETPLKISVYMIYTISTIYFLSKMHRKQGRWMRLPFMSLLETVYIFGFVPLYVFTDCVYPFLPITKRLPFIPLMMTSLYSAIGVIYSWILMQIHFIKDT